MQVQNSSSVNKPNLRRKYRTRILLLSWTFFRLTFMHRKRMRINESSF